MYTVLIIFLVVNRVNASYLRCTMNTNVLALVLTNRLFRH